MSYKVQQSVCSDCVTYVKSRIKFNSLNTFNNVIVNINIANYVTASVCKVMGVCDDALYSESRERYLVTARSMVAYILTKVYCLSGKRLTRLPNIGIFSDIAKKGNNFRRMMSLDKNLLYKCQLAVMLTDICLLSEELYNDVCKAIKIR